VVSFPMGCCLNAGGEKLHRLSRQALEALRPVQDDAAPAPNDMHVRRIEGVEADIAGRSVELPDQGVNTQEEEGHMAWPFRSSTQAGTPYFFLFLFLRPLL
jgi:hypothetical protein